MPPSCCIAVFTLVAFARTYYLRYWFDVPPITVLLHLHSIVFTAWVVLFVIQTRLIAAQNYRTHMQLGIAGIVVATLVVIFGFATPSFPQRAARTPMGLNSQQFVLVPLVAITFFAILVTAAVLLRKRAAAQASDDTRDDLGVRRHRAADLCHQHGKYFAAIQIAVPPRVSSGAS
jgi:hypothetical protein